MKLDFHEPEFEDSQQLRYRLKVTVKTDAKKTALEIYQELERLLESSELVTEVKELGWTRLHS
jgi:hypothetical protein